MLQLSKILQTLFETASRYIKCARARDSRACVQEVFSYFLVLAWSEMDMMRSFVRKQGMSGSSPARTYDCFLSFLKNILFLRFYLLLLRF